MAKTNCEFCAHYVYDEEYECYTCDISLDEDEYARFLTNSVRDCNYFNPYDVYKIVEKQN
jgi:hypothetical protein